MKTAIVTGASRGLGLEWCRQLALEGYTVILTSRNADSAEKAAESLHKEGIASIVPYGIDLSAEAELAAFSRWVAQRFAHVDLLVNNAGVNPKDYADKERFMKTFRLDDLDADEVLEVIRVNAIIPALMVKHFVNLLKSAPAAKVVSISSWLGSMTLKNSGGHYGYAVSKAALNMVSKAMALELLDTGITCVTVNPGWVKTNMGGQFATLTTDQSVKQMIQHVLPKAVPETTGSFFNYDGSISPW